MSLERALRRLESSHPKARFFRHAPVPAGREESEDQDQVFYYVSLYEHAITNAFLPVLYHQFVISNQFISSHIYNLALLCLLFEPEHPVFHRQWFRNALRHNFKKFFAECCLGESNCLLGRALLIETLVYEQDLMIPVFDRIHREPDLKEAASEFSGFMSSMLSNHEFAHYQIERTGKDLFDQIDAISGLSLSAELRSKLDDYPKNFIKEIQCDLFAAVLLTHEESSSPFPQLKHSSSIRLAAFHFEIFSHFNALYLSARHTAHSSSEQDRSICIGSEKRTKHQFAYTHQRSEELDLRRDILVPVLHQIAEHRGVALFSDKDKFSWNESLIQEIRKAWKECLEPIIPLANDLTGTDQTRRGLAQLFAESLHGHDEGVEHLLWRSKRFSVGGESVDP